MYDSNGAKGIPAKGIEKMYLKVMNFRAFSGRFQCIFRKFQGTFRVFPGCFSLCPLWVCPLDPSNAKHWETANGARSTECTLQNQFWRPQKVGLVWSVPISSKENDRAWKKGGGTYHGWGGSKKRFWGGVLWFSPEFSTPLCRSVKTPLALKNGFVFELLPFGKDFTRIPGSRAGFLPALYRPETQENKQKMPRMAPLFFFSSSA